MKFIVAICLVAFGACSTLPPVPVHPNEDIIQQALSHPGSRIIGGNDAEICEYPWQASLMFSNSHVCGAVVVSDKVAITAAHCVSWAPSSYFSIRVGSKARSRGGLVFAVAETVVHEEYNVGAGAFPNDIAILKFNESIIGPGAASVANLPDENSKDFAPHRCTITGWGYSVYGQVLPEVLQKAEMTVMKPKWCTDVFGSYINDGHVCLISDDSASCNGDSGGPLTCGDTLVGVTSFGALGCPAIYPSVYTRITYFRQWIKDNSGV
ncbi:trypsin delta/gamma-like protein CG30031 [Mizuhopecten yessoensis]|uniref:Chymotrypsin-like serine proteinase n=1 Tax=Mizuhopecten yessoensis TaxID=6573 RepID=A0A210PI03_MIZYE|nr:trypsin delta/gamma-like protein CG30031 [Mizuhopecten yessoensis]OWF36056.1 Chymotrypsin-like serine proteinase [Mizuhopecten yessoensis]